MRIELYLQNPNKSSHHHVMTNKDNTVARSRSDSSFLAAAKTSSEFRDDPTQASTKARTGCSLRSFNPVPPAGARF